VEHVVGVFVVADLIAQLLRVCRGIVRLRLLLGDRAHLLLGDRRRLLLAHLVSGASMPERIFRPTLSNLMTSSSSVRVSVLLTTVPEPKAGCETRSPLVNRCTGGGAGAASTWRSR